MIFCLPHLVQPMRATLNSKDPTKVCYILNLIQKMVKTYPPMGEALIPYYRQLLPVLALFKAKNANLGDKIEYSQRHGANLGRLAIKNFLH